jgi:predicted RNA polymerase sigma factor
MVDGPAVALAELQTVEDDPALAGHYRVAAVRAHLLEMTGDADAARQQYRLAARRTLSIPEQRYLDSRAARLS